MIVPGRTRLVLYLSNVQARGVPFDVDDGGASLILQIWAPIASRINRRNVMWGFRGKPRSYTGRVLREVQLNY